MGTLELSFCASAVETELTSALATTQQEYLQKSKWKCLTNSLQLLQEVHMHMMIATKA